MALRRSNGIGGAVALWATLVPALLLFGALVALAPPVAALLMLGAVSVVVALVLPLPWLMVATLVMSALVGGMAEYFLHLSQINWLPFVMSAILAARALVLHQLGRWGPAVQRQQSFGPALFVYPALLYLTVILASAAGNIVPAAQALTAVKNYLMMWGVLVCMVLIQPVERASTLFWRLVLLIAAVQLPVVAYQKFFIASRLGNSMAGLSYDAINGTFGGGLTGGRSGALAMFISMAWAYALILWRDRAIGGGRVLLFSLLALPSMLLMEVKAVVLWLPFVALLVFFARVRQRPILFITGVTLSLLMAAGVVMVYRSFYYAPSAGGSWQSFVTHDLAYIWDPDRFNTASRELGRVSALVFWWREVDWGSVSQWLIGFGPGASRGISTVAVGTIAQKYSFHLDISAAAALLWDLGVLGLLMLCLMLVLAALEARRLSTADSLPLALRRQLEACKVGFLLVLSSVFYVRDAVDGSTIQFVMFFMLGTVAFARRQARAAALPARPPWSGRLDVNLASPA